MPHPQCLERNPLAEAAQDPQTVAKSQQLQALICAEIQRDGWIPFSRYMHLALFAPGLGYYNSPGAKIGVDGDFITAPTLTPLFGRTLARQLAQVLPQTAGYVYEFGAGTGRLAADIVQALPEAVLASYCIVEVSADLRARQEAYFAQAIPHLRHKIRFLETMPERFDGVVFGNELLDAMPCEVVRRHQEAWEVLGVGESGGHLMWQARPLSGSLNAAAAALPQEVEEGYQTELHPMQQAFVAQISARLQRGAMVWIDYGFDASEYYHPQRRQGTLIGHFRHHTVHDALWLPGAVDLTAHVNFSMVAETAAQAGLDFVGYTTQANFLLNLGLLQELEGVGDTASADYVQAASACQKLVSPHEMGELFKVLAFAKGVDTAWTGFSGGDLSRKL